MSRIRPREQERQHWSPAVLKQSRSNGHVGRRRAVVQERVSEPSREYPVGEYLVSDDCSGCRQALIVRDLQRLPGGCQVHHLSGFPGRDPRGTAGGIGGKAQDAQPGQPAQLAHHALDPGVELVAAGIPPRDQRLHVDDDGPRCQFPGSLEHRVGGGEALITDLHRVTAASWRSWMTGLRCSLGAASRRNWTQFSGAFGGRTPGRWRGTRTRSAPGWIAHFTGAGKDTASPSIPTGIVAVVAMTVTCRAVLTVRPVARLPRNSAAACRAPSTAMATTLRTPRSSRERRLRPARSPVP